MKMVKNRKELAVLRDKQIPEALNSLIESFGDRQRGQRYVLALHRFLGDPPSGDAAWNYVGSLSPHTRRAYAAALQEFFEWIAKERERVVPPEEVTTVDVERYVQWLSNRNYTLHGEKLRDGDKPLRLDIYETVERLGTADLDSIFAGLPKRAIDLLKGDEEKRYALSQELGRMVLHDNLVRTPTIDEVREYVPMAGIKIFRIWSKPNGQVAPPPSDGSPTEGKIIDLDDLFIYRVPPARGVSRRTIAAKLAALSSFWDVLREGENVEGGEPVLRHNVIQPILKRVSRGISQEVKQAARAQKPDPVAIIRIMRKTDNPRTLAQYRNRALLMLLLFTGIRVAEACSLRRGRPTDAGMYAGWVDPKADPPTLMLFRKGGKRQVLPYPPIALQALTQFQEALSNAAAPSDAQSVDKRSPRYIPPESARWRYAELVRRADAPLFPSLYLWGANATENYQSFRPNAAIPYLKPMTEDAVRVYLKRLAKRAQLTPDQSEHIHPHALRHFAAVAMYKGGKPLNEIQEMLGHESITTTERYIQELVTEIEQSGQNEILSYLQQFDVPEDAPLSPTPDVIEARGEPVKESREPLPKKEPTRPPEHPEEPPAPLPPSDLDEPQEAPQIAEIIEAVEGAAELPPEPLPLNQLPVVPDLEEDPVEVVKTGDGLVAIGEGEGQRVPRMIGNISSGSPDYVYEALADVGKMSALVDVATATRELNRVVKSKGSKAERERFRKQRDEALKRLEATGYDPIEWTNLWERDYQGKRRPGKVVTAETLKGKVKEKVQKNKWLLEHYDPWPLFYGIGRDSLLPWYARGQSADGYVVEGRVVVPPVPVLSPEQVDPQTDFGARVLECTERTYSKWMDGDPDQGVGPSPTRAFGLVRWYSFLSYLTTKLRNHIETTKMKVSWQPWSATARLGEDVRAHEGGWVCGWLEANAHTYITSVRAFESVSRGRESDDDRFLNEFRRGMFQGRTAADDLPEWFADDDPVNAIHKRSPKEWDSFADWIGSVTGQMLSAERRIQRKEQRRFVKKEIKVEFEELEGQLRAYYEAVDVMATKPGVPRTLPSGEQQSVSKEDIDDARQERDMWQSVIQDRYGIDLTDPALIEMPRKERIKAILGEAFPEGKGLDEDAVEESKNTLGDSQLFDPRYFRLDRSNHTISHTEEFRREFFDTYGQDSELTLRRAARAMWEYARDNTKMLTGKLTSSEYSYLYSMMLAYVSWVVPGGPEMERQIRERSPGIIEGRSARLRWISEQGQVVRALIDADALLDEPDLEQRPDEEEEAWALRLVPLLRAEMGNDPRRNLVNEGNAIAIYKHMMIGDAMEAEEEAHQSLVREAYAGEAAGEGGGGAIVSPGAGREARKEHERKRKESELGVVRRKAHTPNAAPRNISQAHLVRSSRYVRNSSLVLPSPFSMIQAMNVAPGKPGLLGRIFG